MVQYHVVVQNKPFSMTAYPRAILHLDGDAFFTSIEQALVPSLRGRPVVTGKERGIIACASYEARALGIRRGIPLHKARELCPELVILPSDYESYGLFSKRMFNIIRRFTPMVEEYSIDEAFADLTGMCGAWRMPYEDIARAVQKAIQDELGITVSAGLSLSKTLAKICSKFRKPCGFTAVPGHYIHVLLQRTPLESVWGFGPNIAERLRKLGLATAYDFVERSENWAARLLHKPGYEIWNELRGKSAWKVLDGGNAPLGSIVKSKTFTPASGDKAFVYAKLIINLEGAFTRARQHHLKARTIGIVLRHHDFRHDGLEAKLNRATATPLEVMPLVHALFEQIFRTGGTYRSTLVALGRMENDPTEQMDLFEDRLKIDSMRRATTAMDMLNNRFGRHTISCATSLCLQGQAAATREEPPARKWLLMPCESSRCRLAIPRLSIKV